MEIDTILKKYSTVVENPTLGNKIQDNDFSKNGNENEVICVLDSSDEENDGHKVGEGHLSDKNLSEIPSCSFQNESPPHKQLPSYEKYLSESSDDDLPYISPIKKRDSNLCSFLDHKQSEGNVKASCSSQERSRKPPVLSEVFSSSSEDESPFQRQLSSSEKYSPESSENDIPCISPLKKQDGNFLDHKPSEVDVAASCSSQERPEKLEVISSSSEDENSLQKYQNSEKYSLESSDDDIPYKSPMKKRKQDGNNGDCLDRKQSVVASCSSQERLGKPSGAKQVRTRKSPSEKEKEKLEKAKAKAEKIAERNKLKIQAEKEKAEKRFLQSLQKNLKPDQCLKTITVHIDSNIIDQKYGGEILNTLQSNEVSCKINQQLLPGVITWSCQVQSQLTNENGQLSLTNEKKEADEVLIIMNWDELINLVSKETFVSYVKEVNNVYINKRIIIGIYGLEAYFRYHKNKKRKDFRSAVEGKGKKAKICKDDKIFEDAPVITEAFLEDTLTKAQIYCNCNHRMIDSSTDLAQMVFQFTKSIAQIPYKLEKQAKDEQFRLYMSGENRDCVNVDKNGNGLQRVWSQQLTMFPLASLETAEAIMSKYPTPACLMEAYDLCETAEEGEKLLQAIPVRRTAGPLANDKKIGPELSKRIHKFFTSTDGDIVL